MQKLNSSHWIAVLVLLALTSAAYGEKPVDPATDSAQRVELKRADLSGAPGMEVIASTAEYAPGERLDLHFHHGIEVAYVIQGAQVQAPGRDPMTLPTGASVLNLRDAAHGGFTIVGDTSLKIFTVHVVDKGKPLYDRTEKGES